jgi:hypothetical protein
METTEIKRPKRYWLTYIYTISWDMIVWICVLGIRAFWGQKLHWLNGLWCEFKKNSWPTRTWYKRWRGTTLGHGGIYNNDVSGGEGLDTETEVHEHIHVDQYESAMLRAFLMAIVILSTLWYVGEPRLGIGIGYVVWLLGGVVHVLTNTFQAWMRGEDSYRGAVHEESAYAQVADRR